MMDVLGKITKFQIERNWSEYQLAKKTSIPQSTSSTWHRKSQFPTIPSLEKICNAFNITLAQFFTDEKLEIIQITKKQFDLIHEWNRLDENQQNAVLELLKNM